MADYQSARAASTAENISLDAGLRAHMTKVLRLNVN